MARGKGLFPEVTPCSLKPGLSGLPSPLCSSSLHKRTLSKTPATPRGLPSSFLTQGSATSVPRNLECIPSELNRAQLTSESTISRYVLYCPHRRSNSFTLGVFCLVLFCFLLRTLSCVWGHFHCHDDGGQVVPGPRHADRVPAGHRMPCFGESSATSVRSTEVRSQRWHRRLDACPLWVSEPSATLPPAPSSGLCAYILGPSCPEIKCWYRVPYHRPEDKHHA